MKHNFYCLLTFCLLCSISKTAFGQDGGTEEDVKELRYLNSLYIQSFIHSDTATYNHLLWAEDFIQQSPNGDLYTKKECMIGFAQPVFHKLKYFYADDVQVRFITRDVAMIHAKTPFAYKEGVPGMSQYNDVYVRRGGKWVCVSANITKIKQPSKVEVSK